MSICSGAIYWKDCLCYNRNFASLAKISWLYMLGLIFWLCVLLTMIGLSILWPTPHCLDYCNFMVSLEVRYISSPTFSSLILCWLFLLFCLFIRILESISIATRNFGGVLIGTALNLHEVGKNSHLDIEFSCPWTWTILSICSLISFSRFL